MAIGWNADGVPVGERLEVDGVAAVRKSKLNPVERARRLHVGERRRAQTRARLVAAAYKVFALHGAEVPTIDDIILEAGVARGTFYNYFETRDELFRAVADEIAVTINTRLDLARSGMTDPAERLSVSFRAFARYAVADPARGWILLRTLPILGGIGGDMTENVGREFAVAVESGRFSAMSATMALDLGIGFLIRIIYRLLVDRPGADHVDHAAAAMLVAFGLDVEEAKAIAFRPLPAEAVEERPA
ncbi:TetR/AcrR family transcriptional regulator [Sphingomonas bacterium]|uniref:TetR/AcrR family transcriptional regulator n=1 Tax=Sphingomonas bacterium TaxID=1895847 RepID=UPI001575C015|nr:TetR/AcrR family transcriptional regulator [Sphingomonas bacterium]